MEKELRLMKGNEAVAEAAIRAGADGYFGYPITPRARYWNISWKLIHRKQPGWLYCRRERSCCYKHGLRRSSLRKKSDDNIFFTGNKPETGGYYIYCRAELPCLIVNVVRGGPGLGTIQPAQSDYFQAVKAAVMAITT